MHLPRQHQHVTVCARTGAASESSAGHQQYSLCGMLFITLKTGPTASDTPSLHPAPPSPQGLFQVTPLWTWVQTSVSLGLVPYPPCSMVTSATLLWSPAPRPSGSCNRTCWVMVVRGSRTASSTSIGSWQHRCRGQQLAATVPHTQVGLPCCQSSQGLVSNRVSIQFMVSLWQCFT